MLTAPAETVPVDRSKLLVLIWNSCTVSAEKFWDVPPVIRSLTRAPSTVIKVILLGAPPMDTWKKLLGLPAPEAAVYVAFTPGSNIAIDRKLRPFNVRLSTRSLP